MTWANRNTAWAEIFVEELARTGTREAVIAPGSRSGPLVFALAAHPRIRTFVHLDERSAAYFALGIGKAAGRPAAVVTTSGTAAANLFPAVIEASQSETPLLVLTADRPHRLRGQDANQTIQQPGLYGGYARLSHDVAAPDLAEESLRYLRALPARAVAASLGPPAGPVHLNFPFEKPLEPTPVPEDISPELVEGSGLGAAGRPGERPFTAIETARPMVPDEVLEEVTELLRRTGRGLVACGPAAEPGRLGPAALRLAAATGYPLLADPLSGARFAPGAPEHALGSYDLFLRAREAWGELAPDLILRFGAASASDGLDTFLRAQGRSAQVVVDGGDRWKDHRAVASRYIRADAADFCLRLAASLSAPVADSGWAAAWRTAEGAARDVAVREVQGDFFEGAAVAEVASALPEGATLFIGNSMPVRDLEAFAAPRSAAIRVLGNRGASGIDGTVSTALGAAVVSPGPTVAVIGDLALYHDMNGLIASRRFGIDITLVVIDNDGGGIFHLLPIREHEPFFTSHFVTPHGLDFSHAARLYGLDHVRAEGRVGLRRALELSLAGGGARIVEVPSDAARNRERREAVLAAARGAVREALSRARRGG